jgi:hypothetical protein
MQSETHLLRNHSLVLHLFSFPGMCEFPTMVHSDMEVLWGRGPHENPHVRKWAFSPSFQTPCTHLLSSTDARRCKCLTCGVHTLVCVFTQGCYLLACRILSGGRNRIAEEAQIRVSSVVCPVQKINTPGRPVGQLEP